MWSNSPGTSFTPTRACEKPDAKVWCAKCKAKAEAVAIIYKTRCCFPQCLLSYSSWLLFFNISVISVHSDHPAIPGNHCDYPVDFYKGFQIWLFSTCPCCRILCSLDALLHVKCWQELDSVCQICWCFQSIQTQKHVLSNCQHVQTGINKQHSTHREHRCLTPKGARFSSSCFACFTQHLVFPSLMSFFCACRRAPLWSALYALTARGN